MYTARYLRIKKLASGATSSCYVLGPAHLSPKVTLKAFSAIIYKRARYPSFSRKVP